MGQCFIVSEYNYNFITLNKASFPGDHFLWLNYQKGLRNTRGSCNLVKCSAVFIMWNCLCRAQCMCFRVGAQLVVGVISEVIFREQIFYAERVN